MTMHCGTAGADSANGKDAYQAFAVRMDLLVVVTHYALITVLGLDQLGASRRRKAAPEIRRPRACCRGSPFCQVSRLSLAAGHNLWSRGNRNSVLRSSRKSLLS